MGLRQELEKTSTRVLQEREKKDSKDVEVLFKKIQPKVLERMRQEAGEGESRLCVYFPLGYKWNILAHLLKDWAKEQEVNSDVQCNADACSSSSIGHKALSRWGFSRTTRKGFDYHDYWELTLQW